jgi:rare lipoprotein A (peptidoglycan hydrolase)
MDRADHARLRRFLVLALFTAAVNAIPARGDSQPHRPSRPIAKKLVTRASWYGRSFQGRRTAGGTTFNSQKLTAAHRTLSIGSKVKVTELRTGRSVVVQITDRGPFLPGRGIDLSYAAARQLGIVQRGVARVQIELLGRERPGTQAPVLTASTWTKTPWLSKAIVE